MSSLQDFLCKHTSLPDRSIKPESETAHLHPLERKRDNEPNSHLESIKNGCFPHKGNFHMQKEPFIAVCPIRAISVMIM